MSKVSIITPVYNVEKYITNFIKSIINQTFNDFELILVDDGSTDKSVEIAEKILKNSTIKYKIINKKNEGQSSARNIGIKEAEGEWIVFSDSDDFLQKDYLKLMFDRTNYKNIECIICDINNVRDENIFEESERNNKYEKKKGKEFFEDFFMHRISIGPYSLMIKKELLKDREIFFNEESRYSEEFTFICDVLYSSKEVIHIQEKLYNYCLRSGSVSTSADIDKIIKGYREIIKNSEKYYTTDNKYCKKYKKYALPRWVLATARFTTNNLEYNEYKKLMKELNAKQQLLKLITFPELKTRMAAIMFLCSNKIFYTIMRKIKR